MKHLLCAIRFHCVALDKRYFVPNIINTYVLNT